MSSPKTSENVGRPALAEDQPSPPRKTESLVKRLGDLRDGLLLLAGVLYLLGYSSWALYALESGIGFLPVLDSQYFAAGIVPALILLLFVFSVRGVRSFQNWLELPPSERYRRLSNRLWFYGVALVIIFAVLTLILGKSWSHVLTWLVVAYVIFLVVSAFFGRAEGDRFVQLMGLFLIWTYTVLGALWLFLGYNLKIFPHLPSELGGPKPRCAQLDIDVAQLSPETRTQLFGTTSASVSPSVFRSAPVYLLFDGTEYLLLSERSEPPSSTNRVYRLRKDSVKGVFPCPRKEATSVSP